MHSAYSACNSANGSLVTTLRSRMLSQDVFMCALNAVTQVDVPWKYLNFFLEDDKALENIGKEYGSGRMLTGKHALLLSPAAIGGRERGNQGLLGDLCPSSLLIKPGGRWGKRGEGGKGWLRGRYYRCPRPPPTGKREIKAELIKVLSDLVARHQKTRAAVTDDVVDAFMAIRPMAAVADGKA
eukprot:1161225-Pelagomonas_calceolata.AAC.15